MTEPDEGKSKAPPAPGSREEYDRIREETKQQLEAQKSRELSIREIQQAFGQARRDR